MKLNITARILIAAMTSLITLTGCGGLQRHEMLKHPNAPMMILEGSGDVRVAVEGSDGLREYGWVKTDELRGWTLVEYDWSREP